MTNQSRNPYHPDLPRTAPFYGRGKLLEFLVRRILEEDNCIAAVMGGRGMGKTALATHIANRVLEGDRARVHMIERPGSDPIVFVEKLAARLGAAIDHRVFDDSLVEALAEAGPKRHLILIDEVEDLLRTAAGRTLLDNLRTVRERVGARLGVIVFGGSELRRLLSSDTSPFLRAAEWLPLTGLTLQETADLIRDPLSLEGADDVVEMLWEQSGGHPLILQGIMAMAVERGPPLESLAIAITDYFDRRLCPNLFRIWWDNLQTQGQDAYRKLIRHGSPVAENSRADILGPDPDPWIEILETTGLARRCGGEILPRGQLFRTWREQVEPSRPSTEGEAPVEPSSELERQVVRIVTDWIRFLREYPAGMLRESTKTGNNRLLPEVSFQMALLQAFRLRDLRAEPEALSSGAGRSDIKVRLPSDDSVRTCVDLKIWGRNDYRDVTRQVVGYSVPEDSFAAVVMVDRQARELGAPYRTECIDGLDKVAIEAEGDHPAPRYVTRHLRAEGQPLRVYHFLLQLPQ